MLSAAPVLCPQTEPPGDSADVHTGTWVAPRWPGGVSQTWAQAEPAGRLSLPWNAGRLATCVNMPEKAVHPRPAAPPGRAPTRGSWWLEPEPPCPKPSPAGGPPEAGQGVCPAARALSQGARGGGAEFTHRLSACVSDSDLEVRAFLVLRPSREEGI